MQPDRLRLEPYAPALEGCWNRFVAGSKQGTFLLDRRFMDYHADRFTDASFVAFEGDGQDNPVALLPASRRDALLTSHAGLTYGGWITDARMTTPAMIRLFDLLADAALPLGLDRLIYKAIPRCYHRMPADEDLYALFQRGAVSIRQDVSSVIDLARAPGWAKGRKHALAKSRAAGVQVGTSGDFAPFVAMLAEVLARHGTAPVHSADELILLAGRFPQWIRLYAARRDGAAIAYALVFDCGQTVHTQYLVADEEGRALGGLEAIVHHLQHIDYANRAYLSFGISTEQDGRVLNHGLIAQKEMFGGRAMICPTYALDLRIERPPADG